MVGRAAELLDQPTQKLIEIGPRWNTLNQLRSAPFQTNAAVPIGYVDGRENGEKVRDRKLRRKQLVHGVPDDRVALDAEARHEVSHVPFLHLVIAHGKERASGEESRAIVSIFRKGCRSGDIGTFG
jgi:hypothetical protein